MTVTIDAATQQKAYEQFQGDAAMAVSINPKTGEVMALVSTPAYDPNEFVYGIPIEMDRINEDPNRPLLNRFYAALVPGSTFKPITAAIGMDAGKLDPNENKGYVGLSWQKDASWGEYMVTTLTDYGSEVNLQNALVYSDNIYFARAALDIGADTMIEACAGQDLKKNCHLTSVHKYLHLEQTVRFLLKFSWQIQDMGRENYLSIQFILRPFTLHLSMREI